MALNEKTLLEKVHSRFVVGACSCPRAVSAGLPLARPRAGPGV